MKPAHSLAAIILAGFNPAEDPLADLCQGRPKALLPIAGRPMVTYVIDALRRARGVDHLMLVGLDPERLPARYADVDHVPDTGGLLTNARAGIRCAIARHPTVDGVVLSGADIPTISPAIVEGFIERCLCTDHEAYYTIVERAVMEDRFPDAGRTYVSLADGAFAGGDLLLFRAGVEFDQEALWRRIASARKHPLRIVAMLGPGPLLKWLTRRLTVAEAERRVSQALGLRGRAVSLPHPEVAMDVDRPQHLTLVRNALASREAEPQQSLGPQ